MSSQTFAKLSEQRDEHIANVADLNSQIGLLKAKLYSEECELSECETAIAALVAEHPGYAISALTPPLQPNAQSITSDLSKAQAIQEELKEGHVAFRKREDVAEQSAAPLQHKGGETEAGEDEPRKFGSIFNFGKPKALVGEGA